MAAVVGTVALLAQACTLSNLDFVLDRRVDIVHPEDDATATLPLTARWTVEDFDGRFLVVFDGSPMPPGKGLEWFARNDDVCLARPDCPDAAWLAERYIYVVDEPEVTVERLADLRTNQRSRDLHEVVIVLLDDRGRRTGEASFGSEFEIVREERARP